MHEVYLLLGSNIEPVENLQKALVFLRNAGEIRAVSTTWETGAVGSKGPNFLNTAVCLFTPLDAESLKWQVLRHIEANLGRVRTSDKYAPRPIDLDIIIFDGQVLDPILWDRFFAAIPMAELAPDLRIPETGQSLAELADQFKLTSPASPHHELSEVIK